MKVRVVASFTMAFTMAALVTLLGYTAPGLNLQEPCEVAPVKLHPCLHSISTRLPQCDRVCIGAGGTDRAHSQSC